MKPEFLQALKKHVLALSLIAASSLSFTGAYAGEKSADNNADKKHASVAAAHTKDVIMIRNSNGTYGIAKLYLPTGKKCSETVLRRGNNAINIDLLPHGEYIISIRSMGAKHSARNFIRK